MVCKSYKVSVPGSIMLMGEHAVLHGNEAIVMAVTQRLEINLTPKDTNFIKMYDTRLGTLDVAIENFTVQQPFTHVMHAIAAFKDLLPSGFEVRINADFASNLGFGSSAAVTVATIAALAAWLKPMTKEQIFTLAQSLNQGGSGADIAASTYGGTLHYAMDGGVLQQLPSWPDLTAVYCGYKTPTKDVLSKVNAQVVLDPKKFKNIYTLIQECVSDALVAIEQGDWHMVGKIFDRHHQLHVQLGVSDNNLDAISTKLAEQTEILGAKISGAGLGDCVIGLGTLNEQIFTAGKMQQFNLKNSNKGLVYEYN